MSDIPERLRSEVERWRRAGRQRPEPAVPHPGQESVWDYPRPPRLEATSRLVRVEFGDVAVAESHRTVRVLETASPPVYYIPPADVRTELLERTERTTLCEWKGVAAYWSVRAAGRFVKYGAWSYPDPFDGYEAIRDHLAFYARHMIACFVDGERVTPQPGAYYGGWITSDVVGPFKGEAGSEGW